MFVVVVFVVFVVVVFCRVVHLGNFMLLKKGEEEVEKCRKRRKGTAARGVIKAYSRTRATQRG